MLVNAASFPGPALWQAIMLCLILPYFLIAFYKDFRYFTHATVGYIAIGIILMAWIIAKV